MIDFLLCLLVCPSLPLVRFGQLLYAMQIIIKVSIIKVYIERDNLQVELIRFRNFV